MSRAPRDNFAPPRGPVTRSPARPQAAPTQTWDVIVAALLNEMDQRLGAMRSSWMAAEIRRIRALLDESAGGTPSPDRLHMLRQLADIEPSLLTGEAEMAALIEKCEALISRCAGPSAGNDGDRPEINFLRRSRAA